MSFFLLLCLVTCSSGMSSNDPVARTVIWESYKEFIDDSWYDDNNVTWPPFQYSKPSEFRPTLRILNENISDIWGYEWPISKSNDGYWPFTLNLGVKPEHCNLIYAVLEIKFYWQRGRTGSSYVYPAGCSSRYCYLYDIEQGQWETAAWTINIFETKTIKFQFLLQPGGFILFDQFKLTYLVWQDEISCPSSCTSDCEYQAIDCHNYYTCIDRKRKEFHKCKAEDGLAFNPKTNSCDLIENVEGCDPAKKINPVKNACSCEYRPHEDNTTLYYYCPDSCNPENCLQKQCPNGLEWTKDAETGHYQCAPSGALAL